MNLRRKSNQVC